jgi:hypothetical protein
MYEHVSNAQLMPGSGLGAVVRLRCFEMNFREAREGF